MGNPNVVRIFVGRVREAACLQRDIEILCGVREHGDMIRAYRSAVEAIRDYRDNAVAGDNQPDLYQAAHVAVSAYEEIVANSAASEFSE